MRILLLLVALLLLGPPLAAQEHVGNPTDVLVDATYVTCSDTTESLLVLRDGRVVYAVGRRGTAFSIADIMVKDLLAVMERTQSVVDTQGLDSCATIGLILDGPRYLLVNSRKPSKETREIFASVDRIRTIAQRRLESNIEVYSEKVDGTADTLVHVLPSVAAGEIDANIHMSPVAREWKCRGSVYVVARILHDGTARQAFVNEVDVNGKCASLLCAAALRAVLLSSFEPAKRRNGRALTSWIRIQVPFSSSR